MSDSEIQASAQNDVRCSIGDGDHTGQFGREVIAAMFPDNVDGEEQQEDEEDDDDDGQPPPIVRLISASIVEDEENALNQDADDQSQSITEYEAEMGDDDQ